MVDNPHFESMQSWQAARARLDYEVAVPGETLGHTLSSLSLFVMDHRMRVVPPEKQSLEAHYGAFVFSQSRPGSKAARHAVHEVSYGAAPRTDDVGGHEARVYERGPEPEPDDHDGRMPAVVVWAIADRFFLVASGELDTPALLAIARSVS